MIKRHILSIFRVTDVTIESIEEKFSGALNEPVVKEQRELKFDKCVQVKEKASGGHFHMDMLPYDVM